jgi:hypothetical protein
VTDDIDDVIVMTTQPDDAESWIELSRQLLNRAEEIAEERNLTGRCTGELIDGDGQWIYKNTYDPNRPDETGHQVNLDAIMKTHPPPYYAVLEYSDGKVKIRAQLATQAPFS